MSAVLGIVHAHHGLLNLYSEPDKGTTFKIALPVSDAPATQTHVVTDTPAQEISGTVLVIDDEESIREVASMALEEMGFEVITAEDGEAGLACFQKHQQCITGVLLDMTMPRMNGETCFRELRKFDPEVKVILSSGYNAEEATASFQGKGLNGFIQKPYQIEKFQRIIAGRFARNRQDPS